MEFLDRLRKNPFVWLCATFTGICVFVGTVWAVVSEKTIPQLWDEGGWKAVTINAAIWLVFFLFMATIVIQLANVRTLRFRPKGTQPMTLIIVGLVSAVAGVAIWLFLPDPPSPAAATESKEVWDNEAKARLHALEMQTKIILTATATVRIHVARFQEADPSGGSVSFLTGGAGQAELMRLESSSSQRMRKDDGSMECVMQCELGKSGLGLGTPRQLSRTLPWLLDTEQIKVHFLAGVYADESVLSGTLDLRINGDFPLTFTIPAQRIADDEGIYIRDFSLEEGLKPLKDATEGK